MLGPSGLQFLATIGRISNLATNLPVFHGNRVRMVGVPRRISIQNSSSLKFNGSLF